MHVGSVAHGSLGNAIEHGQVMDSQMVLYVQY